MTSSTSTRVAAAVLAPLLLFIGAFVLFTATAFEEGPATGTHVQGYLCLASVIGLLFSTGVGITHALGGSRRSLRAFVGLTIASLVLVGAYTLGFSTWCAHCGSR